MALADSEDVSNILLVLSHPLRREILLTLQSKEECSFTDLLNALRVDTGKLSFHLRTVSAFIEQTPSGKYKLSRTGENALRVLSDVQSWAESADLKRKASQVPQASFKRRTSALLIDFLTSLAATSPISITQITAYLLTASTSFIDLIVALSASFLVTMIFLYAYSTLLEGFNGQTIGKKIIGLKITKIDGKKATYDQAAVRNFGKAFLLIIDLAAGRRLKDPRFIRYFDKYAGTTVINLRVKTQE